MTDSLDPVEPPELVSMMKTVEALRAENARLSEELARRSTELQGARESNIAGRELRRAAMNLMEDAVAAQRALKEENTERRRMEGALRASEERYRAAEERLRLLVESALEHAIVSLDLERRITSWNPGAEAIFGYAAKEIQGESADVIFTAEDRAADVAGQEMRTAMEKGRAGDNRWMQRKDGSRFWANGAMLPIRARSTAGEVIGFVKILRDETKIREAQEALEESRERLLDALQENIKAREKIEAAQKAKDHFLAVLSHELRTPLTPVLMAVRTLGRLSSLPPPVREGLEMIQRNIQIEAGFIDDLLDITRIERGKLELNREAVDLHEIVKQAGEVAAGDLEAKNQRFTMSLEAEHHKLTGDATRLQQVFWNLLKNSAKFTPAKGKIALRTWNEGDRILVSVQDSGIGFTPDAQARIFDPFTQADEDVTRRFGGLGLGLAIAKAAVDGHGGRLKGVSPGPDQGATFTVELPLGDSPSP